MTIFFWQTPSRPESHKSWFSWNSHIFTGVGWGARPDRAETCGPVQVRPWLLQLQENREVRVRRCMRNISKFNLKGLHHVAVVKCLCWWRSVLRSKVMPSVSMKYMSDLVKKYVRFVPSHSWRSVQHSMYKGCQFCSSQIYAGYKVIQRLTVNAKLLRIRMVNFLSVKNICQNHQQLDFYCISLKRFFSK